jgi:protein-tyrosine phosphatase
VRKRRPRAVPARAVRAELPHREPAAASSHRADSCPRGLVDVHCHILPALDDGALDLADSVAMARQAAADGIAVVCATPHIRDDHDIEIDELPARTAAVQAELAAGAIPVHVVGGGEVAQRTAERLDSDTLRRVALGAGGWVLIEPAPGPLADDLQSLVERLASESIMTVLAHPERHAGEDFERRLRDLAAAGCLIQWTAAFVASPDHGHVALALAKRGLLHLLGSDAHSSHAGRPVQLREGIDRLREALAGDQVTWISDEAPWAVLRGERIESPW